MINEQSTANINNKRSSRLFRYEVESLCFTDNVDIPEDAVAYCEEYVKRIYRKYSFKIVNKYYGQWSSNIELKTTKDYQDILVAIKD